jgi:hypothetical protein
MTRKRAAHIRLAIFQKLGANHLLERLGAGQTGPQIRGLEISDDFGQGIHLSRQALGILL